MTTKPKAAMASLVRPLVEPHCDDLDVTWFTSTEEAMEIAPHAEIGWFDMYDKEKMAEIISAATNLKWLNSIYAGVEHFPLAQLKAQGTKLTNGAGQRYPSRQPASAQLARNAAGHCRD